MTFSKALGDAQHMAGALSWDHMLELMKHVQENNVVGYTVGGAPPLKRLVPHMDVSGFWVYKIELYPMTGSTPLMIEHRELPAGITMMQACKAYLTGGMPSYRELLGLKKPEPRKKKDTAPSSGATSPFAQPIPRF